jgi:hypothetical protein
MYGWRMHEVVAYTKIWLGSILSSDIFNFANASLVLLSGGNDNLKSCCNVGLHILHGSDLLATSDLIMARNPNA